MPKNGREWFLAARITARDSPGLAFMERDKPLSHKEHEGQTTEKVLSTFRFPSCLRVFVVNMCRTCATPNYIADALARCTPPLVVVARIVGPPEPRSTLISFGNRPRSVIGTFSGNSEFTFPFTVLVSTWAE